MADIERYIVRGAGRRTGEWAFIYLDEEKGVFTACTSFGDYAYIWAHRGDQSLKEFLSDLDCDYFMGKTRGLAYKQFDFDATIKGMKTFVLRQRRERSISADTAGEALEDIRAIEPTQSPDLFVDRVYDSKPICDAYGNDFEGVICNRPDPQCIGFWSVIWSEFLKQIAAPAEVAA